MTATVLTFAPLALCGLQTQLLTPLFLSLMLVAEDLALSLHVLVVLLLMMLPYTVMLSPLTLMAADLRLFRPLAPRTQLA